MIEVSNFKQIFTHQVIDTSGYATVNETDTQASITQLRIEGRGIDFHSLSADFSKKLASDKLHTSSCHKDSDGIVLFEHSGIKYVLVCELKSGSGQFSEAMKQVVSSYLDFCEAFSLCDGFDIDDYQVFFFITATKNGRYDTWLNSISMKRRTMPLSFHESIIWDNFEHSIYSGSILSDPYTHKVPSVYKKVFINKSVSIVFRTAPDNTSTITVDINSLI